MVEGNVKKNTPEFNKMRKAILEIAEGVTIDDFGDKLDMEEKEYLMGEAVKAVDGGG